MPASGSGAARRYARALLALAREERCTEAVREQLGTLVELVETMPALAQVLVRPLFPAAQRRAVLMRLAERLELSELLAKFCCFLIDQRRMLELGEIRDEYGQLADELAGRAHAEVTSASPLDSAQLERLREALARQTGRRVELALHVDPELVAGVIARVGGLVFDGSLRTQLAQVRASLTKG
jgi:F-type H+-transporting ATPase subunit delta